MYLLCRFYSEDAAAQNKGFRAAGLAIELRDTGQYGCLLPPDQVTTQWTVMTVHKI